MFSNVESFFLTLTFTLACGEELPQSIFHRLTGLGWAEAASLSLAPEARSQIYAAQKLQWTGSSLQWLCRELCSPGRLILLTVPGLSVGLLTSILTPREFPLCRAHSLSQIKWHYYHYTSTLLQALTNVNLKWVCLLSSEVRTNWAIKESLSLTLLDAGFNDAFLMCFLIYYLDETRRKFFFHLSFISLFYNLQPKRKRN